MCLVLFETPLLFASQIAPMFSTLILMGNGTYTFHTFAFPCNRYSKKEYNVSIYTYPCCLVKSLSLGASKCHIPSHMVGTMCKSKFLVSSTNFATLMSSVICNFDVSSILLDSSHTALAISGQECFVRYNNVPAPD